MQKEFTGLELGLMVKNKKTLKNWMVTELITSYSSIAKQSPDEFKVRLSNGMGKYVIVPIDKLNKNYEW
jgi:hypothetical protein